ncbi:MAG: imidazoleglycerol-phosphate dehydratase HisB [Propionibacteriaceae bacterium]|nr:imidazoleglycerol-phosphate dehydratase HisB [Propionibacteriaceae bacterium]
MSRTATLKRATKETNVEVSLDLDGTGRARVATGVGFFDHMLTALAKHSLIDLDVQAVGDVGIDGHHTIEDVAITIGQALDQALGDRAGIARFGEASVPLDEALARCVIDISGRGGAWCTGEPDGMATVRIGGEGVPYAGSMTAHVMASLAENAKLTLHMTVLAGRDPHHIVEAQYKALARALRAAVAPDGRVAGVPSTKGSL